jgi:hypothetical protein
VLKADEILPKKIDRKLNNDVFKKLFFVKEDFLGSFEVNRAVFRNE